MTKRMWQAGAYEIEAVHDGLFEGPLEAIIHADGEQARAAALSRWGKGALVLDVWFYVLRGLEGVTLIDAGGGSAMAPALGRGRAALTALGISPQDVRQVLLTHIHGDHALGLLEGEAAFFPHAELWLPQAEWSFYSDPAARERVPVARRGAFEIMAKVERAYQGRLRGLAPGSFAPGLSLLPLPGHTPGHSGFLIGEGPERLLLFGDVVHDGALQASDPDIGLVYDLDPAEAILSRKKVLEQGASEGWTVAGGHVGFSRVKQVESGFSLELV